jgi:hypothetical protein
MKYNKVKCTGILYNLTTAVSRCQVIVRVRQDRLEKSSVSQSVSQSVSSRSPRAHHTVSKDFSEFMPGNRKTARLDRATLARALWHISAHPRRTRGIHWIIQTMKDDDQCDLMRYAPNAGERNRNNVEMLLFRDFSPTY